MFCKNGSHIQEQLPTLAPRLRGGSWGGLEFGCRCDCVRLSVRVVGVTLGIQRGTIVDSAGCLGVGLCGEQG